MSRILPLLPFLGGALALGQVDTTTHKSLPPGWIAVSSWKHLKADPKISMKIIAWQEPPAERLTKDTTEYLGFKVDDRTFRTCRDERIEIEDGVVEKTEQPCPEDTPPTLAFGEWKVEWINTIERTFGVEGATYDGKMVESKSKVFYPQASEDVPGNVGLDKIQPGDVVSIGALADPKGLVVVEAQGVRALSLSKAPYP